MVHLFRSRESQIGSMNALSMSWSAGDFNFWRFDIDTVLLGTERLVHHFLDLGRGGRMCCCQINICAPTSCQRLHATCSHPCAFVTFLPRAALPRQLSVRDCQACAPAAAVLT